MEKKRILLPAFVCIVSLMVHGCLASCMYAVCAAEVMISVFRPPLHRLFYGVGPTVGGRPLVRSFQFVAIIT